MIQLTNVSKVYHGEPVLKQLNLTIVPGEFIYLIGKSGAGKSTLLKLLTGQVYASEGIVTVASKNLRHLKEKELVAYRRDLGVVFQDFRLVPELTALSNISYPLELLGLPQDEIRERSEVILKKVGLADLGHFYPNELSGGQQQRVGIARAIVTKPSLVIADEPTANLDLDNGYKIIALLEELKNNGTTIIMATHNPDLISRFPQRLLELASGQLIRDESRGMYYQGVTR